MKPERVIELLNNAQAQGAKVEIDLQIIPEVSVEAESDWTSKAKEADQNGEFSKPALIYFSLYQKSLDPSQKVMFGINCAQMLINASDLEQAATLLNELENAADSITDGDDQTRWKAAVWEKRGWIADCQENPEDEIKFLTTAQELIEQIPDEKLTADDNGRLLTIEHFIGRALYKKHDLEAARQQFENNLVNYTKDNNTAAMAFNYAWLARVAIAQGKLSEAEQFTEMAKGLFSKAAEQTNSKTIEGHSYRIQSELAKAKGEGEKAVNLAVEALRLTLPPGGYYNGVMEAVKDIVSAQL